MPEFTLTALDVTSIQRYVFASNRLKENVGASELVHRATHQWAFEALPGPNNVSNVEKCQLSEEHIEDGVLAAEIVYAGGGNTLILFADEGEARRFVKRLSEKVIEEAPGLELVAAHVSVDWDSMPLGDSENGGVRAVMEAMAKVKRSRDTSAPLLGMGVTAACQSTGLVAVDHHKEYGYPISAEVDAKLSAVEMASERLLRMLPQIKGKGFRIPQDFDYLGRSRGEKSYIAVVHADGNQMGRRVREIANEFRSAGEGNRAYITEMRYFSDRIEEASQNALRELESVLLNAVCKTKEGWSIGGEVPILDGYLPFRPLVFGGDDLTFVCDGRLGLTLAAEYLKAFEKATKDLKLNLYACAGIAVVKSHYPFARAYQMAESLCSSAKRYVRQTQNGDFSALDWHFAASGLLGDLSQIREREYEIDRLGPLCMRPVRLYPAKSEWRTWDNFMSGVKTFKYDEQWAGKHNKVVQLRQALRGGPGSVKQFRTAYEILSLPDMQEQPEDKPEETLDITGWARIDDEKKRCGYFDPIEAMDFVVPLDCLQEGE